MMRITSWNLQGREGLDLDAVATTLLGLGADVIALQEVQKAQAAALADRLGWRFRWWFKHWSIVHPAEGLAILSPGPIANAARVHLAHRWRFWSWRRRIAVMGRVEGATVVDVHLGSGVGDVERTRQAHLVLAAVAGVEDVVIAGDFNTKPGSGVLASFAGAGFRDAWDEVHGVTTYATNWRKGRRSGPPTQRLDYVVVRGDLQATDAVIGDAEAAEVDDGDTVIPEWARFAALSDHAPITVSFDHEAGPASSQ